MGMKAYKDVQQGNVIFVLRDMKGLLTEMPLTDWMIYFKHVLPHEDADIQIYPPEELVKSLLWYVR